MAMTPRPIDYRERFTDVTIEAWTPDDVPNYYASFFSSVVLNLALIFIIFPLMCACIGLAKIADGWNRLRLRKRSDAAIQEPAKPRPRRAF